MKLLFGYLIEWPLPHRKNKPKTWSMLNCYRKNLLTFKRFATLSHKITLHIIIIIQDVQANETRITSVNQLAKKLLDEGHPDVSLIISKQKVLGSVFGIAQCFSSHSWLMTRG